jgi:hypothetical protein
MGPQKSLEQACLDDKNALFRTFIGLMVLRCDTLTAFAGEMVTTSPEKR